MSVPAFDEVLLSGSNPYLSKIRYWDRTFALFLYTFSTRHISSSSRSQASNVSTEPFSRRIRLQIERVDEDYRNHKSKQNTTESTSSTHSSARQEKKLAAHITNHLLLTRIRSTRWLIECTRLQGISFKSRPLEMYADYDKTQQIWSVHGPVVHVMQCFTMGTIQELGVAAHIFTNVVKLSWKRQVAVPDTSSKATVVNVNATTDYLMSLVFDAHYLGGLIRWTVNRTEAIPLLEELDTDTESDSDEYDDDDREDFVQQNHEEEDIILLPEKSPISVNSTTAVASSPQNNTSNNTATVDQNQ